MILTSLSKRFVSATVLGLILAASACQNDTLNRPFTNVPVDRLFERYVAMGNSITAGFQSAGINDSTQSRSYAVLLAQSMHSPFFSPLLKYPGCPPPYTNVFTGARLTPTGFPTSTGTSCYLRAVPATSPPYISNTAVPGARVFDLFDQTARGLTSPDTNALMTFFLGGLTQVQMARRAQPTFISLWIGNNDVLGAATNFSNAGDSTRITPIAQFQTDYAALVDSIASINPRGAILIGVANVTAIPFFSAGATYWAIKNGLVPGSSFPVLFTVSNNCAPVSSGIPGARGDQTLVPFPYGAALLGQAQAGAPANLDCGDNIPQVVVPAELAKLTATVAAYNTFIAAQAAAKGWAYYDPNPALAALRTDPAAVRPFPLIGAPCINNPFGTGFSCDAVHPSNATHRLIASQLRDAINSAYTTAIPPIP